MPYLSTMEVETKLELLSLQYPGLCQWITLTNTTYEGRTSHAVKLRTGPRAIRPAVCLIGGVHAWEWGSSDILVFLAETLLVSYQNGTDVVLTNKTYMAAQIRSILENVDLVILPVVNPDGRTYSQAVDIWWRKNRAPTPQAGVFGTDINRNYDFLWDYPRYFAPGLYPASNDPTWETYHGTSPWSEAETSNVKQLVDAHPYTRYLVDVHSYDQLILYPWGDDALQTVDTLQNFQNVTFDGTRGILTDTVYKEFMAPVDYGRYQAVAQRLNQALQQVRGMSYIPGPGATTLYIMSGSSKDYMYSRYLVDRAKRKIDSYLIEWGTAFQPPYAEMASIIQDVSAALIELCLVAQEIPLIQKTPDPLDFGRVRTGTTKSTSVSIRNLGVGQLELFSIQAQGTGYATTVSTLGPIAESGMSQIPVTFTPSANGPVSGRLVFQFREPGSTLIDISEVLLQGSGCSVPKGSCTAPVFQPVHWLVCLLMWIAAPAVLLFMLIFIWIPGMLCALKRFLFRLRHCAEGNSDPCKII